jgi:hypothetical protein
MVAAILLSQSVGDPDRMAEEEMDPAIHRGAVPTVTMEQRL